MRILRERGIDATVYAVGMALERNPEAAAEIAAAGSRSPVMASVGSTISSFRRPWNAPTC